LLLSLVKPSAAQAQDKTKHTYRTAWHFGIFGYFHAFFVWIIVMSSKAPEEILNSPCHLVFPKPRAEINVR